MGDSIVQKIQAAFVRFDVRFGLAASVIYLGENEWQEFREYALAACHFHIEQVLGQEDRRAEYCGRKIYRVDAVTYLEAGV